MTSVLRRRLLAPVAAFLLPAYLAGCFHYVPVDAGWTPPPGANIMARLSGPTPFSLGTVTINDVQSLEGLVVDTTSDSLGLWVKWLHPMVGSRYDANSVQFYLQRRNIAQMERWRMSPGQTALLIAASGAALVGMFSLLSLAVGGGSGNGGDGGQVTIRLGH